VAEKAAIAAPARNDSASPVFVGHNPHFIIDELRRLLPAADIRPAKLDKLSKAQELYNDPYSLNYLNAHQVVEYLLGHTLDFQKLSLPPCRQEQFGRIMLDGAHNASGMLTLLGGLERANKLPAVAIVSSTAERDLARLCKLIEGKVANIITTTIPNNPRSVTMERLAELGYKPFSDPFEALAYAKMEYNDGILIAGSLYLCALIRQGLIADD
jgi:dihydrofolate synthase/folylpolyglutamate synthase